jgi:DNA-binding MurR/RpiR family transcriptional regulator
MEIKISCQANFGYICFQKCQATPLRRPAEFYLSANFFYDATFHHFDQRRGCGMDYSFYGQIRAFAHDAKGSKRQVAQFLLEHTQDAAFMTVGDMAERIGVSPGTISKVAQAMGFKGVPDIQERIRQVILSNIAPAARMEMAKVDTFTWAKSMKLEMENLRNALSRNSVKNLDSAVLFLAESPVVHVMGTRSSYALAHFLAFNLGQVRDHVCLVEPKPGQFTEAVRFFSADELFVAVGLPRYQRDTVLLTGAARKRGCRILAITDSIFSPLAKLSDLALAAPCDSLSFFNSYVAAFALVNGLLTHVALRLKETSADALEAANRLHEKYHTFFNEHEEDIL